MGSLGGAAIGALIIGLAEQIGLFYAPTYSIFLTFVIMAGVLAVRPQGLFGRPACRPGAALVLAGVAALVSTRW
jgi:branched-chain amino acid transport system permease protein